MKKKIIIGGVLFFIVLGLAAAYYIFQPHRDVQATSADIEIGSRELVQEFVKSNMDANDKYLAADGESKILAITGKVSTIEKDGAGLSVVLLKDAGDEMGVSCTFLKEFTAELSNVKVGDEITVKGVIRSGAEYDEDLELYEDAIVEKCSMYQK